MKKVMLVLFFMLMLVVAVGCNDNKDDIIRDVEKSHQYSKKDALNLTEAQILEVMGKLDFQADKAIRMIGVQNTKTSTQTYYMKQDILLYLQDDIDFFTGTIKTTFKREQDNEIYEVDIKSSVHGDEAFIGYHFTHLEIEGGTAQDFLGLDVETGSKIKSERRYTTFYSDPKSLFEGALTKKVYKKNNNFILSLVREDEMEYTILYDDAFKVKSILSIRSEKEGDESASVSVVMLFGLEKPTIPGFDDYILDGEA